MSDPTPPARRPDRIFAPDFLTELFRNPLDPGYADAAARRRADPAAGERERPTARVVSAVVLIVVGFVLAVAYRQTLADEPSRSQARAGLVSQIKDREAENDRLTRQADALREEVARQRDAALTDSAAARLRDLEAGTGLARVTGDGVVVRVADAPNKTDAVTGAGGTNLGRVLDRDLQDITNALWSTGAEAISINGQRLTATSTIRAAGGAILVDFRPVNSPYEVSAVGPSRMVDRFKDSDAAATMRAVAAKYGMAFGVKATDNLALPAANEPQLRYARPSPSPSPSRTPTATPSAIGTPRPSTPTPTGGG